MRKRFRLPAEWEPHEATWVAWPRREGISFPGAAETAQEIWARLVEVITRYEPVHVNVFDDNQQREVIDLLRRRLGTTRMRRVVPHVVPAYEPWIRDHGPIFVEEHHDGQLQLAILDWGYNAWGGKYPPYDLDDQVPRRVSELLGVPCYEGPLILEGGAIDTNGQGLLLASATCLLHPKRNPEVTQRAAEATLKEYFGVDQVVWLEGQLEGDDTDGHVDELARFVASDTVLVAWEENRHDPNAAVLARIEQALAAAAQQGTLLRNIVRVPLPQPIYQNRQRLPATYLNFYILNDAVIVPVYDDPSDERALGILQDFLPGREVVSFFARDMIWGLGAVHCATQQQPAIRQPVL
jgi:agmatine deiminase